MTVITAGTDIKPLRGAIIRRVTLGTTVTKGNAITLQDDGYWDPTDTDTAQLTVAIAVQGGVVTNKVDAVIYGPVQCITGATPGVLAYGSDDAGALDDAVGTADLVVGYIEAATILFVRPQIISFT